MTSVTDCDVLVLGAGNAAFAAAHAAREFGAKVILMAKNIILRQCTRS